MLEQLQGGCTDSDDGTVEAITVWCPDVISDLRAALENDAVARDREEQGPLPKTEYTLASGFAVSRMPGYTADQMRAYASAAVAAERDRRSSAGHFRGAGMTDRELLELAAKAAGIAHVTPMMIEWGQWNPLTDDGDALRLAVKCAQLFGFYRFLRAWIAAMATENGSPSDPIAATRRAITRAAAGTARLRGHLPQPDAVERERSNEIRRLAIRALCAWDESVLPKSNDGMMQERMEDLRAAIAQQAEPVTTPIWETLAEIGESAPAGTWDALPAEKLQGQHQ